MRLDMNAKDHIGIKNTGAVNPSKINLNMLG